MDLTTSSFRSADLRSGAFLSGFLQVPGRRPALQGHSDAHCIRDEQELR